MFFTRQKSENASSRDAFRSDLESECRRRDRLFQLENLEPRVLLSAAPVDAPADFAADPEPSQLMAVEESADHEQAQTPAEEALAPVVSASTPVDSEELFEGVQILMEPSLIGDLTLSDQHSYDAADAETGLATSWNRPPTAGKNRFC
jgi:hypothetical protein